jgi:hypothetical protein
VLELIQQPASSPSQQPLPRTSADEAGVQLVEAVTSVKLPPPVPPPLQLRMQGELARFVPQWRVRR